MCAAHSHSLYGRAFSTLGKELDIITQDACAFWKVKFMISQNLSIRSNCVQDHAVYTNFGGIVLDEEEGKRIVEVMGKKKVSVKTHRGVPKLTTDFVYRPRSCK